MAVLKERRGEGIGRAVLDYLIDAARRRGFGTAVLHAQLHAEGFYLKSGFQPVGDVFEEAGIPHREMTRAL
jgi:predicted GNAT family N-acyltransferase